MPSKSLGKPLRLDEPFAAARRAAFEVGMRRGTIVVGGDDVLAGVRREMHGAVTEIDLGLSIVEREPGAGLGAGVVPHVAVRDGIALRQSMIGVIEIAVLGAVAVLQEPAVPIRRQRQLHVIGDAGR